MKLTRHFSLEEFTRSNLAARSGIDNSAPPEVLPRLRTLATTLENIREFVSAPIFISSGFRCGALNSLTPGSSPTSGHRLGWAADINATGIPPLELAQMILHSPVRFDQLIFEYGAWVHISVHPRMRRQVLTKKTGKPYLEGLVP
jgi:uncharacterized protein YcbK (DUF882 family)